MMFITITLSGDAFDLPVRIYQTAEPIERQDKMLSKDLWSEILEWNERYVPFTGMTVVEITPHLKSIRELDQQGIRLTRRLAKELFLGENNINSVLYYSLCDGGNKLLLYRDGGEKTY